MPIGFIWQTFLETPLINLLLLLTTLSFGSYGLAILVFTVITRAVTFPSHSHAPRHPQDASAGATAGGDQEEVLRPETPLRGADEAVSREGREPDRPASDRQLIQMPVFIALYQVIRTTVGATPEAAVELEHRLYDLDLVRNPIPPQHRFPLHRPLAERQLRAGRRRVRRHVAPAAHLQHRTTSSSNSQQAQMTQTMQWMMPVMFAWFVVVVPAGLGLYWAATTISGIVLQWIFVGPGDFTWGSLVPSPVRARLGLPSSVAPAPALQRATRPR